MNFVATGAASYFLPKIKQRAQVAVNQKIEEELQQANLHGGKKRRRSKKKKSKSTCRNTRIIKKTVKKSRRHKK